MKEISLEPLHQSPWKECYTSHFAEWAYLDTFTSSGEYRRYIDEAAPNGDYSFNLDAYITIYDDDHLMCVE